MNSRSKISYQPVVKRPRIHRRAPATRIDDNDWSRTFDIEEILAFCGVAAETHTRTYRNLSGDSGAGDAAHLFNFRGESVCSAVLRSLVSVYYLAHRVASSFAAASEDKTEDMALRGVADLFLTKQWGDQGRNRRKCWFHGQHLCCRGWGCVGGDVRGCLRGSTKSTLSWPAPILFRYGRRARLTLYVESRRLRGAGAGQRLALTL